MIVVPVEAARQATAFAQDLRSDEDFEKEKVEGLRLQTQRTCHNLSA